LSYELHPEAVDELEEHAAWYETRGEAAAGRDTGLRLKTR
jgi:hypothetical protein